ncbi:MAG: zinc-binding dehydrogenase [Granulosicoccus sp.]
MTPPLIEAGADAVLIDGDDPGKRCRAITGSNTVKLAIDAVAGTATNRLADCLSDGGTIVNYGLFSGDPCQTTPYQIVFRSITLTGFWLARFMGSMSR